MLAPAPKHIKGHAEPRIAPPRPVRSTVKEFKAQAAEIGIDLMPHQVIVATYLEGTGRNGKHLYPTVAAIISRQQGKTEILVPFIVKRLRMGRKMMHAAQNRLLPREVHSRVADIFMSQYRDELKTKPRFANGQESIELRNGGRYRIAAATRGGARGPTSFARLKATSWRPRVRP